MNGTSASNTPNRVVSCSEVTPSQIIEADRAALLMPQNAMLQDSATKSNDILNSAIAAIASMRLLSDHSWQVDYYSAGCEIVFGFTAAELLADQTLWMTQMLPEDFAAILLPALRSIVAERTATVEYRFRHKDGSIRWIAGSLASRRDQASKSWLVTTVSTDITERKQTEAALRESQHTIQRILNATPQTLYVFDLTQRQTNYLNRQIVELLGYAPEDFEDAEQWVTACLHPDDQHLWQNLDNRFTQLADDAVLASEYRLRHQDGSWRWFSNREVVFSRDEQGAPRQILGAVEEISDRKQAEVNLRQTARSQQQAMQRERLVAGIAQNIRQSLDLDYILSTFVQEVQQFLQADRVLINRFKPDWSGEVIAEALGDDTFSLMHQVIHDPCFGDAMLPIYRMGHVHMVHDVLNADLKPCYRQLLAQLQVRALLVLPILVAQEPWGLFVVHQCAAPRHWKQTDRLMLQQLSTQLAIGIHQAELYQKTQQQARRDRILSSVTQALRTSLNLGTIFAAATTEIGMQLQVDRAEIVQYLPAQSLWLNVASYCNAPDRTNTLGVIIPDAGNVLAERLKQGEMVCIHDNTHASDPINQFLAETDSGIWLLVPLQIGTTVWGNLSLNYTQPGRRWQAWEIDLARTIADQLAIAIQQSQLYQTVQQLNDDLEHQVQVRTAQLQQALDFEALLQRITTNMRDSLDEGEILETVVTELVQGLAISGCDVALFDDATQTATIAYESLRDPDLRSVQGQSLSLSLVDDLLPQLSQGETLQFCRLPNHETLPLQPPFAVLNCLIVDDQQVLGDLCLSRLSNEVFSPPEIRLVQQVANQCAIAIRQARLYQAAQAQVTELARLNQLKDDFLSTISHELRSPLSNIKMATQMLEITLQKQGVLPDEASATHRYFQILHDECQRETNLITDLLNLSRLDAAVDPLILSTIDLSVWLPHVIEPFHERIRLQRQQLQIDLPARLPTITTDLSYLTRILTELLTNAYKYSPAGETISLAAEAIAPTPPDHHTVLQIRVSNTGVEIPPTEQARIFEKFYRLPNNDPWRHSGTGLGLALVQKLTEQLGATIHVESTAGKTTFMLQFLLDEAEATDER